MSLCSKITDELITWFQITTRKNQFVISQQKIVYCTLVPSLATQITTRAEDFSIHDTPNTAVSHVISLSVSTGGKGQ